MSLHPLPRAHRPAPRRRTPLLVAALFAVAVLGAACGGGGGGGAASTSTTEGGAAAGSGSGGHTIVIKNFEFSPSTLTVSPGTTVTVTNDDGVTHTLTALGGKFDSGDVGPGQSKTFTAPAAAGSYPYDCTIHTFMKGTLVVS